VSLPSIGQPDLSIRRVVSLLGLVAGVVVSGGAVLWLIEGGRYSLFDSIYFALITIATVGYGELPEMSRSARVVAMVLIVAGVGSIAVFHSSLTALLVEGVIGKSFRRRRMQRRIAALERHVIVAGCGRTGRFVVDDLLAGGEPFVVVDRDLALLESVNEELGGKLLYVAGDATDDHVLVQAGIGRAAGLIAALTDDRDNLFVTLSARAINPKARIVAKVVEPENEPKILKVGADRTVSPHRIGGQRLVSELVRPKATEFLDQVLRVTGKNLRVDDVELPEASRYAGHTLREARIREHANLLVVAVRERDGAFVYNPPADYALAAGSHLIVIGEADDVAKLRSVLAGG
jgi:voltage-gated potassium channel